MMRKTLPQLGGGLFLTDGGIETSLIFNDGLALPDFAAFHLLKDEVGQAALRRYLLKRDALWTARIRGLRANASRKSHAELNESAELDLGDPAELGAQYAELRQHLLPRLNVMGGCCGTDHRHVERIAAACAPLFRAAA